MANKTPESLKAARDAQAEAVRLQEERDKEVPTPTQDELNRMKAGEAVEGEGEAVSRATAAETGAPYKTRDTKSV